MAKLREVVEATMKLSDEEVQNVLTLCREDKFFITLYPRYSDRIIGVIQYTQQNSN